VERPSCVAFIVSPESNLSICPLDSTAAGRDVSVCTLLLPQGGGILALRQNVRWSTKRLPLAGSRKGRKRLEAVIPADC